jgi:L-cysteine:1D-myo-inositol 2-amino-2-deoxy-alpha-D-glucopyranoside ligase
MAIRLALLSGHYRTDRAWTTDLLRTAEQRLATWRQAVALEAGAPAAPVLQGLRERLADDLDSPGAIELVDAWAAATLAGSADAEEEAPRIVCDAVDALLGVALDSCARDRALGDCG